MKGGGRSPAAERADNRADTHAGCRGKERGARRGARRGQRRPAAEREGQHAVSCAALRHVQQVHPTGSLPDERKRERDAIEIFRMKHISSPEAPMPGNPLEPPGRKAPKPQYLANNIEKKKKTFRPGRGGRKRHPGEQEVAIWRRCSRPAADVASRRSHVWPPP